MADSREQPRPQRRAVILHHCLSLAVLAGCTAKRDRDADALAAADPAEAAARVAKLVDSCGGFSRALEQLSRISGRLLAGLVDDAIGAARPRCTDIESVAARGSSAAHQLARARLADDRPAEALAQLQPIAEPAVRYRRAELLDRLGRASDALVEIDIAFARAPDEQGLVMRRLIEVSAAARSNRHADVVRVIASAPIAERPSLAFRAVADTPPDALDTLATAASSGANAATTEAVTPRPVPELAVAAADRLEELRGPAAVVRARERLAVLEPDLAEHWDALGRARIVAGQIDAALAAWDRAIAIAPAQPSYRLTPITALVIAGKPDRARERAGELAKLARADTDVELLVTASAGAAASSDAKLALALAREAKDRRPGDGRLAFLVAQRLVGAGDHAAAIDAYGELLVCGAHGRAWHRHEVAGKLLELGKTRVELGRAVLAHVAAPRACPVIDPVDLETYVDGLQKSLAEPR